MKALNQYITEYLIKKKVDNVRGYKYTPQTKNELIANIKELLDQNITDFNCIDVSAITDMSKLFYDINNVHHINFDVSEWNVSNVENMNSMFAECRNFNCDLSKWNVEKCNDIGCMFEGCWKFNCDLSNWNVSNVTNMAYMFQYCVKFDCDLSNWDVSNVTTMVEMFYNCTNFKGKGLEKWNTNNVKSMHLMFSLCKSLKNTPSWYK